MRRRLPEDLVRQVVDLAAFRYRVASCAECTDVTLWSPGGPRIRLYGHFATVNGASFFPDGSRLLTWSQDGDAIVWDATSGALLVRLEHGGGAVSSAKVFPQGDRIVTGGEDGRCIVWDAASGVTYAILDGCDVRQVEVFPDGYRLLTWALTGVPVVWDLIWGVVSCKFHGHSVPVSAAAVFPGGDRVITGSLDNNAIIWDASSCKQLFTLNHSDWVTGVAVVGLTDVVGTTTSNGGTFIWSASSGEMLHMLDSFSFTVADAVYEFKAFPQDVRLLTINAASAIIWDAAEGLPLHELRTRRGLMIYDAAVAPGGDTLVTCSGDLVHVWDANTGDLLHELVGDGPAKAPSAALPRWEQPFVECFVAVGLGSSFDPEGFGRGLPWRELPQRFAAPY